MAGRDVEKHEFVGSLLVIPRGHGNRVARILEVDEVRSLDHTALIDVETRNDPLRQHAQSQTIMPTASMLAGKAFVEPNRELSNPEAIDCIL